METIKSIEQKAKAYDEAIERAKSLLSGNRLGNAWIYKLLPELKESEDERIRKDIISLIKKTHVTDIFYDLNKMLAWLEKQSTPQVRTGLEWVNTIDDACDKRYLEEYAHGEYCHEQSFRWGFQEGVDWLEKQGEKIDTIENFDTEFEKQVSCLIASTINKEHEYNEGFVKWAANALLNYAKHELEKQGEQKSEEEVDNLHNYLYDEQNPADEVGNYDHKKVLQTIINEQNPAWNEEDERMLNFFEDDYDNQLGDWKAKDVIEMRLKFRDWLKSLKERMKGE